MVKKEKSKSLGKTEELKAKVIESEAGACSLIQKKVEEVENKFRIFFEGMESGGVIYRSVDRGRDFEVLAFNQAAEKIEKIDRKEVLGKRITEVFPGIAKFGLLDVFRAVLKTGVAQKHPISLYNDGRISGWRENYVVKLSSDEIGVIYEDKTEDRKKEEEFVRKNRELEKINNLMVGRELKMIELKNRINELEQKIKIDLGE
jgi:transcriptional regulator with PAS, ATPase and Fis domain